MPNDSAQSSLGASSARKQRRIARVLFHFTLLRGDGANLLLKFRVKE